MYQVRSVDLAPIQGIHQGTGKHGIETWIVDPASVPPTPPLRFTPASASVTTMLFQIDAAVVPNWFAVAVPSGITSFTNATIYFHPTPGQAGYVDADYAAKAGKWPELFYYMERMGYQLDVAAKDQVIVMPLLTQAAADTGIFPASWQGIVSQILGAVRASIGGGDGSPIAPASVVVSSFSAGIVYSDSFRRRATGLSPVLREIWDLDGSFSTNRAMSEELRSTAATRVTKYDQSTATDTNAFHVPLPRWSGYPSTTPPTSGDQVHGLIASYMFFHAAWLSTVGARSNAVA